MSRGVKNFSNIVVCNECNCGYFLHSVHIYAVFIKCIFVIVFHHLVNEINVEKSRKDSKFSVKHNIYFIQMLRLRVRD